MELREALRGTGSVRAFTDEPVPLATVRAILDDARFAPSGGNRQGWKVAVVQDGALRRSLAALMQATWDEYLAEMTAGSELAPFSALAEPVAWTSPAPHRDNAMLDGIESVPVVLVVAVDLGKVSMMDRDLERKAVVGGGSIYPFCWSILLAARERGIGGVLTTFLAKREPDAAPLLGLPAGHAIVATIFLGHPVHQPTKLTRLAVDAFTTIDRFDGPALPEG